MIKDQIIYYVNLSQGRVLVEIWRVWWGGKPLVRDFRENSVAAYIEYKHLKDNVLAGMCTVATLLIVGELHFTSVSLLVHLLQKQYLYSYAWGIKDTELYI